MTTEEENRQLQEENRQLREENRRLREQVEELSEEVKGLREQLAKNSQNSSLPPSSDRFHRQKRKGRSLREKSGRKPGGQPGHRGVSLPMMPEPDETIPLAPVNTCEHCQADLSAVAVHTVERRQVIDVPPPPGLQVKQYEGECKICPHCQSYTHARFPEGVNAPVQYGPRIGAMAVYLSMQQLLPRGRTAEMLSDLLGVHLSQGTLTRLIQRTAILLEPVEQRIKAALMQAKVKHHDETGLYCQGQRIWWHVTSTGKLTHYQVHQSRGHEALDEIGLMPVGEGISVHDGWGAYFLYDCQHSLCCVHILRELIFLSHELGLWWARKLLLLLLKMKKAADEARAAGQSHLPEEVVQALTTDYLHLLSQGDQVHPRAPTRAGKRGKAKQHPARNLLDRLRKHQDAVLHFLSDLAVPFDNNQAERDVRMVKVQQKVSGTFRSDNGPVFFARIRGYLSTLRKQGLPLFSALHATLQGQPLLPSF
jgi:transposase